MAVRVMADVPYGNVCDVEVVNRGRRPEVRFAADPRGSPEALWFCFRVTLDNPANGLRLVLKHPDNILGGHELGNLLPVIREARGDWERLPGGQVDETADGRRIVTWELVPRRSKLDVALCYPYGKPELESLLTDTGEAYRVDTIGVSQGGRPIVRLSSDYGEPGGCEPGIYLLARQHSGETPGSWVLDGLLRRAARLSNSLTIWAIPFANVDGVEQGDYGKDNYPYDLNRAWGVLPMRHEVLVVRSDLLRWRERCQPVLAIDFHAPGACEAEGAYFFVPDLRKSSRARAEADEWCGVFAESLRESGLIADLHTRMANYPSRWESPSFAAYLGRDHGICALTLETPYALAKANVLTRERYREIGARMLDAIANRLELSAAESQWVARPVTNSARRAPARASRPT